MVSLGCVYHLESDDLQISSGFKGKGERARYVRDRGYHWYNGTLNSQGELFI